MSRALIAMSGGVDSSIAAYLMKNKGYECVGCTMKLFDNEDAGLSSAKTCCSLDDVEDARSVAFRLGMNHYVFNVSKEFRQKVIADFVRSYEMGETPNPCIQCNRYMKFEKLHERARLLGCDLVVTGHYARIEKKNGEYLLKKALDESKDQSYVLYSMTQEQLAATAFPLGEMRKSQVRIIAEENGFVNAEKPDSQDICFVPDGDYAAFMERYTGRTYPEGDFVSADGKILGRHRGIVRYTVGQRRGLGLAMSEPVYVKEIDTDNNRVVIATNDQLYSTDVLAREFNWISGHPPKGEVRCRARVRYRQSEQPAAAAVLPDGRVRVTFDEPQRAVTPGQAVVLYDGDVVLGGGVITKEKS